MAIKGISLSHERVYTCGFCDGPLLKAFERQSSDLSFMGGFFMFENKSKQSLPGDRKLTPTMKIVLTAVFVALSAVINSYGTIRLGTEFKFSFVLVIYFVSGYLLGAPLGFAVGFIGDLLGWVLFVDGAYNPIIGISNGMLAFIPGLLFGLRRPFSKRVSVLRFIITCVIGYILGYIICTVILSSYGIWLYTSYIQGKYQTLYAWFIYRAGAQLPNTLINLIATVIIFIPLKKIKGIKEYL